MKLEVLIFGAAALAARSGRLSVDVPHPATAADVLAALEAQHPSLAFALKPPATPRLAVNHAYVPPTHTVSPADELALITLLGGG